MINSFTGEHFFLSNFYERDVTYRGITYKNNEAAFQAQKTLDENIRKEFANLNPSEAKKKGRQVKLREDWEEVKFDEMYHICIEKFLQNPDLAKKLYETGEQRLEEGNTWGDKIWGTVNGEGENKLGQILMMIRPHVKGLIFDAVKVKNECVEWIADWFEENGKDCNAVIGISGGKDSTVVAALCCEALGKDRVIGVLMPNGVQNDIEDSYNVVNHLGIKSYEVNIKDIVDATVNNLPSEITPSKQTMENLPPRIRMATLFAIAQSVNGRVSCNCNHSEDYVGYSTFGGDDFGSFAPLRSLTTDEVVAIGEVLGLPNELIHKVPADGLCGKTDEDNLGFSYATLNGYIRTGLCTDDDIKEKIDKKHNDNYFKLMTMNVPRFRYWP